jgi:ATP-dependent DNA helicase RecG
MPIVAEILGAGMLSASELKALFEGAESHRVERKASFMANQDRIRQAICAFANDLPNTTLPGVIFIGQNDDGSCANLMVTDQLLLNLSHLRDDGKILPLPSVEVEHCNINGCNVAVVLVAPSDTPPVRVDGRTWIRVGPRRGTATIEEERRLTERQRWRNLTFDAQPFAGATLDDLDITRFEREYLASAVSQEVLAENGRGTLEQLRALRLATPNGNPTNAAILLFGKNPRSLLPGSYIQFLRVNGTGLTDEIVSQKEVSGTISDQVRQIEELLRLNSSTGATIEGTERKESVDFPFPSLQQLVRNAIMHRNYEGSNSPVRVYWFSDRVEIHSPGGLYGEVTPETIWKNVTSYRNPMLAEGMKVMRLVERFGFGLSKAQEALRTNDNPPLEYDFVETFVLFTVRKKK